MNNRELKFRVWDKANNQFWHNLDGVTKHGIIITSEGSPGLVCDKDLPLSDNDKNVFIFCQDKLVVQQYTGLQDKNGKDIYEGDIIEYTQHNAYKTFPTCKIPVIFDPIYGWVLQGNNMECSEDCKWIGHYIDDYGIKIIGNIFENPDLLNK